MNRPSSFDRALMGVHSQLCAFAMNLTRNREQAEDLVQDTIVQALRYHDRYTHDTNFGGWLRTMMRNLYYTQFRQNRRTVEDPDGAMAAMVEVPGEQEPHIEFIHVMRAVDKLTPEHREAIAYAMNDTPYEQIMEERGLALGTVKSRTNRARVKLAEMVA